MSKTTRTENHQNPRPTIVCLCGSTRFWRDFQQASLRETLSGRIVLSIGAASGTDDEHFGNLPKAEYDRIKERLDQLHLRKIEMADEVLILNVGGYIGESTRREVIHAMRLGKHVRWLESRILPECKAALDLELEQMVRDRAEAKEMMRCALRAAVFGGSYQ